MTRNDLKSAGGLSKKLLTVIGVSLPLVFCSSPLVAQDAEKGQTQVAAESTDDQVSVKAAKSDDGESQGQPAASGEPQLLASGELKKYAITFDDLKFEMEKTDTFDRKMLTQKINGYHGGSIKIRGYIRPNFKQSGITKFIFVRDNKECCFGPQAAIFDNILVRLAKGKSAEYTVRPITVEGKFVLKEYVGPDGNVWSLYRMYDAEIVR